MVQPTRTVSLQVELPEEVVQRHPGGAGHLSRELRELWVLEQVRTGRISTGKGAGLCGLPRAAFMLLMGDHGIPVINYPVEDFEEELREVNRT